MRSSCRGNLSIRRCSGFTPRSRHSLPISSDCFCSFRPSWSVRSFLFAIVAIRRWNRTIIALLGLLLVVPLFQAYSYRAGQTFGFLRFYISLIPAGVIAACELIRLSPPADGANSHRPCSALAYSWAISPRHTRWNDPTSKRDCAIPTQARRRSSSTHWTHPTQNQDTCRDARAMAEYIGAHMDDTINHHRRFRATPSSSSLGIRRRLSS